MSQEIGIQIAHFITRQRFSANLSAKHFMGSMFFPYERLLDMNREQQIIFCIKSIPTCIVKISTING